VALIEAGRAATFTAAVATRYEQATGLKPALYVCQATDGAAVIE
jgi:galactokinase